MQNSITLDQAIKMTTLYRALRSKLPDTGILPQSSLLLCETFSRDIFDFILAEPGCTGMRIYYGMSDDNKLKAIIVGINDKNEDILPSSAPSAVSTATTTSTGDPTSDPDPTGGIGEDSNPCPPFCPPPSPLNP
ncbi:MAG: hypothetical protein ACJ75B_10590 [Flavisolibacter sp.]